MQSVSLFLSTVTAEFRSYRDALRSKLQRPNVTVQVQEDFIPTGTETLDKLDLYIKDCDAVIHLLGDRTGAWATAPTLRTIKARYPDLAEVLPALKPSLETGVPALSYTQWEAYLAVYHRKVLVIAEAAPQAPRDGNLPVDPELQAAQRAHRERLRQLGRYPEITFTSIDQLIAEVLRSTVIDLLAKLQSDQAAKAGPTVEQLVAALDAKGVLAASELAGLQRRIIISLAHRLKPGVLDFEQAVKELERAVEVALDVIATGERGTSDDAFVNTVLARAAEKVRNDDFDGGADTIDLALAELEAKHRQSKVVLLEEGVKVDTLRRDSVGVARRIEMIVAVDHPTDRPAGLPDFRARYDAYLVDGKDKGINFSLSVAIELARRMHAAARDAEERGIALNLLGVALSILGERESDPARLEQAVAVYRDALKEYARDRTPLEWAQANNNLGNALRSLGERETGPARLEEAVAVYRDALKEYTRGRVPLDWAMVKNNLGHALCTIGLRTGETARLEEAVAACREALEERTRERMPLDWATTKNNLGNALQTLGAREVGTARLAEAVAAYRDALAERTREHVPLDWAMTKSNLGNALAVLSEHENGTARLEEAIAASHDALEEFTRGRAPFQWATTKLNLGAALARLGARQGRPAPLVEAVAAYRDAMKEFTRERMPLQWAAAQHNLGAALAELGRRESAQALLDKRKPGTARLEEGVIAFREALKERTRGRVPLDWAATQHNLGTVLTLVGALKPGTAQLKEAVVAFREALKERTRERVPLDWAETHQNLGKAEKWLAVKK
jgi:tetratricopeptide (TPR) repeat protein